MMNAVPWITSIAISTLLASPAMAKPHEGWTADFDKALEQAKKENKVVLLEFTGSDWCPPCKMMRKNVFSKKEFVEKASKHYVLVELDFPNGDPDLKKKNEPYAKKYEIKAFPTIVLVDADGNEFARFIASAYPEVDAFIAQIEKQFDRRDLD